MHPDTCLPADVLHAGYVAVMSALAFHEPAALKRLTRILDDERSGHTAEPPPRAAVELVRAWLAFMGHVADTTASPPERVFSFAFPATITFDVVGSGTAKSVSRRAMRALRASQLDDVPLGVVAGPHPTHPELLNLTVWAGSFLRDPDDRLVLELASDDDETEA